MLIDKNTPKPPEAESTLEVARRYLALGLSVVPLNRVAGDERRSKQPAGAALKGVGSCRVDPRTGEEKGSWQPYQERLPTEAELQAWFGPGRPPRNLALVGGAVSGRVVWLDFDQPEAYQLWQAQYPTPAAEAPTQQTGRGYHVGLRWAGKRLPGNIPFTFDGRTKVGELRGEGGLCTVYPSVHGSGVRYIWLRPPWDYPFPVVTSLAEIGLKPVAKKTRQSPPMAPGEKPPDHSRAYMRRVVQRVLTELGQARVGERNNALNAAAYTLGGWLAGGYLVEAEIEADLRRVAEELGLTEAEIGPTLHSGLQAGQAHPGGTGRPGERLCAGRDRLGRDATGCPPGPGRPVGQQ